LLEPYTGQMTGQMTGQITRRRRRRRRKGPVARLLVSTDFALLWLKHCMTALGDALFSTTLIIWLATQTGSALYVALALFALGLPYALCGPFADAATERWSRRKIMFVTDVVRGILTFLLPLALLPFFSPHRALALICLLCFFIGAMARFSQAAQRAALNVIVPPSEHARGISRVQGSVALITIFGPILAAVLFVLLGQNPIPGMLFASFVLLLSAGGAQAMDRRLTQKVMAIRARQRERGLGPDGRPLSPEDLGNEEAEEMDDEEIWIRSTFKAGWANGVGALRLVLRQRPFGTIAGMVALIAFAGGMMNALEVFFVSSYLHRAFPYAGLMLSAHATGVLLGSVWFQQLDAHLRPEKVFAYAALGMGLTTAGFVSSRVFVAGLLWAAAVGVTNGLMLFAAQTALVETGERKHFLRLLAGYDMLTALLGVLGILLGGALARLLTIGTVLGGASLIVLLVGFLALLLLSRKPARAQQYAAGEPLDEEEEGLEDAHLDAAETLDAQMAEDEPEQPEYAPPPRASQQFGRLRAPHYMPPEADEADDHSYEQNGAGDEQDWEQPPPAPHTPLPRGRTRSRAAPWEQSSGAGRGPGLRSRFGHDQEEC
jgi:MFS family permease